MDIIVRSATQFVIKSKIDFVPKFISADDLEKEGTRYACWLAEASSETFVVAVIKELKKHI